MQNLEFLNQKHLTTHFNLRAPDKLKNRFCENWFKLGIKFILYTITNTSDMSEGKPKLYLQLQTWQKELGIQPNSTQLNQLDIVSPFLGFSEVSSLDCTTMRLGIHGCEYFDKFSTDPDDPRSFIRWWGSSTCKCLVQRTQGGRRVEVNHTGFNSQQTLPTIVQRLNW